MYIICLKINVGPSMCPIIYQDLRFTIRHLSQGIGVARLGVNGHHGQLFHRSQPSYKTIKLKILNYL